MASLALPAAPAPCTKIIADKVKCIYFAPASITALQILLALIYLVAASFTDFLL
jgi:hypothetical protein